MGRIELVVFGNPEAQKRHRHSGGGKFVRVYDPSSADKKDFLSVIQDKRPRVPIIGPIKMEANFFFARPANHFRTGKNAGVLKDSAPDFHTSRPDFDNLCKFVMDAMNGVFFKDDSQVVEVYVTKKYDLSPRTELVLTPLTEQPEPQEEEFEF